MSRVFSETWVKRTSRISINLNNGYVRASEEIARLLFFVILSVIAVGLLVTPARAQEKTVTPAEAQDKSSRDKGISLERLDTRVQMVEKTPAMPQQIPCSGNNHTTNSFNNNILMGGPVVAISWIPNVTNIVSRVEVFTGESAGPIGLAIWSDNAGKPQANLGDTGYFPLLSAANSWQGKDLLSPVIDSHAHRARRGHRQDHRTRGRRRRLHDQAVQSARTRRPGEEHPSPRRA